MSKSFSPFLEIFFISSFVSWPVSYKIARIHLQFPDKLSSQDLYYITAVKGKVCSQMQ